MSATLIETARPGEPLFYLASRVAVLERVFGPEAGAMARAARVEHGHEDTVTRYEPDDALPEHGHDLVVTHTAAGWQDIVVVVHEFAHYWHNRLWPDLSLEAPDHRTEAAAAMAEVQLAAVADSVEISNAVLARFLCGHSAAVCSVLRNAAHRRAPFPDCVGDVLRGEYG